MQYIMKHEMYSVSPPSTPEIAIFNPVGVGAILLTWTIVDENNSFPCLEVFDDAWGLLASMPAFIQALARLEDLNAPPDVVAKMLDNLGYRDVTQREAPDKAVA